MYLAPSPSTSRPPKATSRPCTSRMGKMILPLKRSYWRLSLSASNPAAIASERGIFPASRSLFRESHDGGDQPISKPAASPEEIPLLSRYFLAPSPPAPASDDRKNERAESMALDTPFPRSDLSGLRSSVTPALSASMAMVSEKERPSRSITNE